MLEQYFHNTRLLKRRQLSYLGNLLEDYVKHLREKGYSYSVIVRYCQCVEHFGYWLARNKISVHVINEKIIQDFLKKHLLRCDCPLPHAKTVRRIRPALRHLLIFCIKKGICSKEKAKKIIKPQNKLLVEYDDYLDTICGFLPSTRIVHKRHIGEFLEKNKILTYRDIKKITREQVEQFVFQYAKIYKHNTLAHIGYSLHSFFKFLQFKRYSVDHLIVAIPHFLHWSLSEVPTYFEKKQLSRLLKSFDRSTPIGKRNYSIACCFVCLGLRCSEVAALQLDDINWHEGILVLQRTKPRRVEQLPLPQLLANALSDYIQHGRVNTSSRSVFVHHYAPLSKSISGGGIDSIMRRACKSIGLPFPGTNIFRRSLASQMLNNGATIKEISDVLRHKSINTTMIYTKIDLTQLSRVVMPWAGEDHE